ncbi:MAG TPA: hypothetical protein ENF67_00905 [Candidatus Pacearchaeota archaeon]|nr:hypothetical protein [Candidatus Pacearchaeota archaeon]
MKKKEFEIEIEILNEKAVLKAFSADQLLNKTLTLDLTKKLKGKASEGKFIIKEKQGKLKAEMYQFKLHQAYIKRLIGKGISIVEDSFVCQAKDSKLRIKPFLITRRKVHRSVRKALRSEAKSFIEKFVKERTREKVFQAVLSGLLQRMIAVKLKKIYPLTVSELRVVKVEKK